MGKQLLHTTGEAVKVKKISVSEKPEGYGAPYQPRDSFTQLVGWFSEQCRAARRQRQLAGLSTAVWCGEAGRWWYDLGPSSSQR